MNDTESGQGDESIFNENNQVWAGGKRELQNKLSRYYGVEDIWVEGDFYHEERDEYLYDVLTYFDGDKQHFITDDVPVFGHGPSGAVGIDRESLPAMEDVQSVVEAVEGGEQQ